MDPSDILPYELLEMIWLRLDVEKDLLSCRRVSSSWRESLEASRAWSRWCCSSPYNVESRIFQERHHGLPTRRRPWEYYLSTKKMSAAWSRGMFQLQTRRRSAGNENGMIHLGKTYVYICSEKGILFYDLELKTELHRYNFEEDTGNCMKILTSVCGGDDTLGVLLRSETGYRLKIFQGLGASGLTELAAVSRLLSAAQGGRDEVLPSMAPATADQNASRTFPRPNSREAKLCLTDGCIHEASNLLKSMDLEASPCDDFYQFACGKFRTKQIPDDKSSLSSFSEISDDLQTQLRTILEEKVQPGEPKPYTYAKTLYRVCMNKSRIEKEGEEKARLVLKSLGGWPVLEGETWDDGSWDWREAVYTFRQAGFSVDYIIDFSISVDYKNTTYRIIDLDQASLGLNREFFVKGLENRLVSAYAKYMVDLAVLLGAEPTRAARELADSLDFEMQLANISLPMEKKRNATLLYNKMTIRELQSKFPSIPWREYISRILPAKITVDEEEPIIVEVPSYISDLEKILAQTPKRVVANYMMWRATSTIVGYLPEKYRARQLEYYTAVTGTAEREPRWKECVDQASSSLSLAVGSLYIQKYFDEDAKKNALDLVKRVRTEMYKILETVDWMDEKTRKSALVKAKSMTEHIAYPDELLDNNKLEKFYEGYEVSDGHFLDAVLNTTKFAYEFNFGRLRDPVNKTEWFSHGRPTVVNAYYNSIENSIQFPAGILQGTFFSNKRPKYMNYGAIGYVIGHEITHGFDDQGRQFDAAGNLVDWWAPETKEKYLEKARCIIEQYGNFTDSQVNMSLNGINTQGENIADNGGIKEAYKAYVSWLEENGEEPRLPGLQDYSPRQMFWISAASVWCSVYRNETLSNRITTGYHSPGEFRVKGPMSNRPEFAADFNCPLGSPMNPVKKCQVW